MVKLFLLGTIGGSIVIIIKLFHNGLAIGFAMVILVLCVGFCGVIGAIESLKPKKEGKEKEKTDST